ncbi:Hpt domain-containing protein [Bacteriovorax sp. DB6_IX]|uniref:Hpt domain-containing protein n=1 Tax=Bacteriovorax sp. DB6_IX TaxID=1353530 RepID=UPI000389EB5C|nr:Hpt domain-containing protein [Bacteriovorax sp. DB6_IX]EQC52537.1 Hpt domain protein [Bacteriovorax sp. DB6_IX]
MKFDENELNLMFGDDPEIFQEIFGDFVDSYNQMLQEVEKSITDRNSEGLQISAHTLKGVLATFCSTVAKEHAFELEEMGRDGKFDDVEAKYEVLKTEVGHLIDELKNFSFNQAA